MTFDAATQAKLLALLSKWFHQGPHDEDKDEFYVDDTVVMALVPQSDQAKEIMKTFGASQRKGVNPSPHTKEGQVVVAQYPANYVKAAISILEATEGRTPNAPKTLANGPGNIRFRVYGDDYPIIISNDHFEVMIAPRFGDDQ